MKELKTFKNLSKPELEAVQIVLDLLKLRSHLNLERQGELNMITDRLIELLGQCVNFKEGGS